MCPAQENQPEQSTTNDSPGARPFDHAGGRRFTLVAIAFLTYTALLVGGYLDSGAYVALQLGTIATYIAGNGAQKYTETRYGQNSRMGTG